LSGENFVNFRNKVIKFKGEFYGKPTFSPDGKTFAFRNSFTGPTKDGRNIPFYQYNINGFSITDLQVQTGLTFAPDGKKWVMCGMNGKDPYLYVSSQGMAPYTEFPGLGAAPPELYKEARFANGKIVLLFQPKKTRPVLFIEDKGTFEFGEMMSAPETLSISPDGKTLVLGCNDKGELRAFTMSVDNPGVVSEILKKSYDLQNLGKGTFVWKNDHELQFLILRNSDLIRISATYN
jgi:WD40 repeat protein